MLDPGVPLAGETGVAPHVDVGATGATVTVVATAAETGLPVSLEIHSAQVEDGVGCGGGDGLRARGGLRGRLR